jgi:hypothetical protein
MKPHPLSPLVASQTQAFEHGTEPERVAIYEKIVMEQEKRRTEGRE